MLHRTLDITHAWDAPPGFQLAGSVCMMHHPPGCLLRATQPYQSGTAPWVCPKHASERSLFGSWIAKQSPIGPRGIPFVEFAQRASFDSRHRSQNQGSSNDPPWMCPDHPELAACCPPQRVQSCPLHPNREIPARPLSARSRGPSQPPKNTK